MKKVNYKYNEDKALSELKKYIDATYDEHYSKNKFQATEFIIDAHHWLILHGRYCCIARKPKCGECIVSDVCNWKERFDYGAEIPELK